jgi:hypothetical protein
VLVALVATGGLAACGSTSTRTVGGGPPGPIKAQRTASTTAHARPQVVEPQAGVQAKAVTPNDPVGDPHAHAPPISQVRAELKLELVAAQISDATYTNPLPYVTCCGHWERTDQGVDASMPPGSPIVAPSRVKILGVEPGWYAGQPLIYFELLAGQQAGQIQYVAEQITDLAPVGSYLSKGQAIARFAKSGTGIEYGWSTAKGVTLAVATTGYEEGQETPAGKYMRAWLNSLGANAGPNT